MLKNPDFKLYFRLLIPFLMAALIPVHSISQSDWKLKKQKNGIKVYTKDHKTENIKYYRLITSFKGDLERIIEMNLDFDDYENWVKDCEESRVLKRFDSDSIIYYLKLDTPWPVSDRDFVSVAHLNYLDDQGIIITIEPATYEYPKEEGIIRLSNYHDKWIIKEEENKLISIELEGFYDPGGAIPAWVVNMFIVDAPYQSMLYLKNITEIKD